MNEKCIKMQEKPMQIVLKQYFYARITHENAKSVIIALLGEVFVFVGQQQ